MAGSFGPLARLPPLRKLVVRLGVTTVLTLWVAFAAQSDLIRPMLPMITATIESFDDEVRVLDVGLGRDGPNETVRFHLNLARPVTIGGYTIRPYGSPGIPSGAMEVNLGVASLLQYSLLLLILVIAYPANSVLELGSRLSAAAPLFVVLIVFPGASTVLSLLWGPFHTELAPKEIWPILNWSRFLSGGGGLVLAMLASIVIIGLGRLVASLRRKASSAITPVIGTDRSS